MEFWWRLDWDWSWKLISWNVPYCEIGIAVKDEDFEIGNLENLPIFVFDEILMKINNISW